MMADSHSDPELFEGTNAKECEVFVATIRQRALAQGKQRDNEWIALFASSYFVGDALYWYEDLEESIQNDWSRLRPALLARFGRKGNTPTTSSAPVISGSTSSITIPTPAAAPPSTNPSSLVRKGRLKVLNSDGRLQGYIPKSADTRGFYELPSGAPNDALLVSFSASVEGPFEIQIIPDVSKNPQVIDVLAIAWEGLTGHTWMERPWFKANCCSLSAVTSKATGAAEQNVWTITKDGELGVNYPKPDGGSERLRSFQNKSSGSIWWAKLSGARGGASPVRIVFEDVI